MQVQEEMHLQEMLSVVMLDVTTSLVSLLVLILVVVLLWILARTYKYVPHKEDRYTPVVSDETRTGPVLSGVDEQVAPCGYSRKRIWLLLSEIKPSSELS